MNDLRIRPVTRNDCDAIADIYNYYIRETIITFEEEEVSGAEIARRLAEVEASSLPWIVAEEAGKTIGYAYAAKWKARSAYRFSTESTLYLANDRLGKGIGTRLYRELLEILSTKSIHAVMGGIALPNPGSVALHERFGFKKVAHFEEVGFKFSQWIDVGYWQRSP